MSLKRLLAMSAEAETNIGKILNVKSIRWKKTQGCDIYRTWINMKIFIKHQRIKGQDTVLYSVCEKEQGKIYNKIKHEMMKKNDIKTEKEEDKKSQVKLLMH